MINNIIDEDEEENKIKIETHLDSIKKKNKLNIYVGEFETYTAKNQTNRHDFLIDYSIYLKHCMSIQEQIKKYLPETYRNTFYV